MMSRFYQSSRPVRLRCRQQDRPHSRDKAGRSTLSHGVNLGQMLGLKLGLMLGLKPGLKKGLSGVLAAAVIVGLAGCGTKSRKINLSSYAPVIDVKGQGHDLATYQQDLEDCRMLGMVAQAKYDAQREQELEEAKEAAIIGTLAGAILGHAVGGHNDYHTGRAATAGAVYGAAIGGSIGAENVDYNRTLVKFGPTGLVDRCLRDRGYKILSAEGYGGG